MRVHILLYFLVLGAFVYGQNISPTPALQRLNLEITRLTKDPDLKHAQIGFYLGNAETGQQVTQSGADINLIPASSLKLLTTGAALGILGPEHRFITTLEYDGAIDAAGTLNGNIYLKGGADPTLGSPLFKGTDTVLGWFAEMIKHAGIKKINGAVIGDGSIFPAESPVPGGWIWADIGNYYGAGSYGLNYLENSYTIYFRTGHAGEKAKISRVKPELPGITFVDQVTSGGSTDNAYIYAAPYTDFIYVNGTVPANRDAFDVSGAIPDPVYICALDLTRELKRSGIEAAKGAANLFLLEMKGVKHTEKRKVIASYSSPSLDKIIYLTNMKSHNMFAETLLRFLAVKAGKEGTVNEGLIEMKKFYRERKIDVGSLFLADGSGLSRSNAINAKVQAEILRSLMNEPWFDRFRSSLHVYHKNIQAKSGYMNKARSYAGYVKGTTGTFVFSFIVNNYTCSASEMKEKMERIMALLPTI